MEEKKNEKANKIVNILFLVTLLVALVMSVVFIIVTLFRVGGAKNGDSSETQSVVSTEEPVVEESEVPRYTEEQLAMMDEAEKIYAEIQRRIEIRDYYALPYYFDQIPWYEDVAELQEYYSDENVDDIMSQDFIMDMVAGASDLDGYQVTALGRDLVGIEGKEKYKEAFDKGTKLLVKQAQIQYEMGGYKAAASAYEYLDSLKVGDYAAQAKDSLDKVSELEGSYTGKKYDVKAFFMDDGFYLSFTPKKGNAIMVAASLFDGVWTMFFDASYEVTFEEKGLVVSSDYGMLSGEYKRK